MSPAVDSRDRLTLLLALVPYLMERENGVSVSATAAHFEVRPEEVRRAVRMIAVSGIPGETQSYQSNDLFDIDWDEFEHRDRIVLMNLVAIDDSPRFSAREAAALIAGLQYLQSLPGNANRAELGQLMAKLTRGASSAPTPLAVRKSDTDATLLAIRSSLEAGVQLLFDYAGARGQWEQRRVDPLRLELIDGTWYLRAWCHTREAVRTFRLDRISNLKLSDDVVSGAVSVSAVPEGLFNPSDDDLHVELLVAPSAVVLLADYLTPGGVITEADEVVEVTGTGTTGAVAVVVDTARVGSGDSADKGATKKVATPSIAAGMLRVKIRVAHFHGLKRLVGSLSGVARVVSPPQARQAVADWAQAGLDRYEE